LSLKSPGNFERKYYDQLLNRTYFIFDRQKLATHRIFLAYPNGVRALEGTSFSVEPGEIVAVVGGSGSRKSTLLRAISGLDRPTQGCVLLDGEPITSPHEKIGVV